jgi:hypothetical protein
MLHLFDLFWCLLADDFHHVLVLYIKVSVFYHIGRMNHVKTT